MQFGCNISCNFLKIAIKVHGGFKMLEASAIVQQEIGIKSGKLTLVYICYFHHDLEHEIRNIALKSGTKICMCKQVLFRTPSYNHSVTPKLFLLGVKAGLLSRLNQQEHTIMQLQSDTLKHEFLQQHHEAEIAQLQWQLADKDKEISALRNELVHREKMMDKQRAELEDAARHIEDLQYAQVCTKQYRRFVR